MLKIESPTLEQAYKDATKALECSIVDLHIEVIQTPKNGLLGFFRKNAIIVVAKKEGIKESTPAPSMEAKEILSSAKEPQEQALSQGRVSQKDKILNEIESEINKLFAPFCFELDRIKVSFYDDETIFLGFDGKDAALLIGKEGYRYKALSYMLFNWINSKYGLQLRLEIAEFLQNQEEAIFRYLETLYDVIEEDGRVQTKTLDGVLIQIALKELRSRYADKYVAIRTTRDGLKYIMVNENYSLNR